MTTRITTDPDSVERDLVKRQALRGSTPVTSAPTRRSASAPSYRLVVSR